MLTAAPVSDPLTRGDSGTETSRIRRGLASIPLRDYRFWIIQLLLGNMGRPGGGIMALRGHASIQGSTDQLRKDGLLKAGCFGVHAADDDSEVATHIQSPQHGFSGWFVTI